MVLARARGQDVLRKEVKLAMEHLVLLEGEYLLREKLALRVEKQGVY